MPKWWYALLGIFIGVMVALCAPLKLEAPKDDFQPVEKVTCKRGRVHLLVNTREGEQFLYPTKVSCTNPKVPPTYVK